MPLPRFLHHVLDFCYPGVCAGCESSTDGGATLCINCAMQLDDLASAPACDLCAMPLPSAGAPCPHCSGRGVTPFDRIIRLGVFDDPLKHLIHQMKYHKRWALGEFLADRLFDTERAKGLLTGTEVLVPVPLHIRRHIGRGYNQADVIARRLHAKSKIPVVHAVRRSRYTETQTHLHSLEKRRTNVKDAFALHRAARHIRGKHVVVVDDVMTVGATLREVGRLLKRAEPASLCAVVLALVDPKGRGFEVI